MILVCELGAIPRGEAVRVELLPGSRLAVIGAGLRARWRARTERAPHRCLPRMGYRHARRHHGATAQLGLAGQREEKVVSSVPLALSRATTPSESPVRRPVWTDAVRARAVRGAGGQGGSAAAPGPPGSSRHPRIATPRGLTGLVACGGRQHEDGVRGWRAGRPLLRPLDEAA